MYKLCILLTLIATGCSAGAQITGYVTDGPSGKPLPNANVFISSTSRGTVSNTDGYFELSAIPPGKYDLIISMVGYETIVHSFSTAKLPLKLKVQMEAKVKEEESVTVVPFEKSGWERWGLLFTENFIGESLNASRCKFLNPGVLKFRFNKKAGLLEVVADDILVIENKALGYRIKYQLEAFVYNTETRGVVYAGYPLFEEMEKGRQAKYYKNRKKAYYGSAMHLMRSLFNNTVAKEGFELRRLRKIPNLERQRVKALYKANAGGMSEWMKDSARYYGRIMNEPDYFEEVDRSLLTADSLLTESENPQFKILSFPNFLLVHYKNEPVSDEYRRKTMFSSYTKLQITRMYFVNDATQVEIEANGNYYNPVDLFTDGYMGWEKMSDLLPLDYEPPAEN